MGAHSGIGTSLEQIHAQRLISQQDLWPGTTNCWHDSGHILEFTKGPQCVREYCAHVIKLDGIALKSTHTHTHTALKGSKASKQRSGSCFHWLSL